jgi:hypothetical protein
VAAHQYGALAQTRSTDAGDGRHGRRSQAADWLALLSLALFLGALLMVAP